MHAQRLTTDVYATPAADQNIHQSVGAVRRSSNKKYQNYGKDLVKDHNQLF